MKWTIIIIFGLILFSACQSSDRKEKTQVQIDESYINEFDEWQKRVDDVHRSYMTLVALYPVDPSEKISIGADSSNTMVFDLDEIPPRLGYVYRSGDSLIFDAKDGVEVRNSNNERVSRATLSVKDSVRDQVTYGRLTWKQHHFADKVFIRVYDSASEQSQSYEPFDRFDLNSDFIFRGRYEPFDEEMMIKTPNSMKLDEKASFVGEVSFEHEGRQINFLVQKDGFIMFGDKTNGDETYGAGRYLYIDLPDNGEGEVIIDFNKAYNPPCSYSEFTTCRFPPARNVLSFAVNAGEKYSSEY